MTVSKIPTVVMAAGAVLAAGAGGYFLSEIRQGDVPAPAVEAVAQAEPAGQPPVVLSRTEPDPAPQLRPASGRSVSGPGRTAPPQAIPVDRVAGPEPPGERTPPLDMPPAPAMPEPAPSVTAIPIAPEPMRAAGLGAVPVPNLEPPIERIELTVERGSVIGVRLEEAVSSATARVEDRVVAIVTREVVVNGRTAIPAGSRVEGHVTFVEPGGKFREKARVGIEFTTLVLPADERLRVETEPIFRDGESPAGEATSKIGASAVVGTVLGAIVGGKKGAAIGGAAGAAGGTAVVAAGGVNDAILPGGATLTLRLVEPVTVVVERRPE